MKRLWTEDNVTFEGEHYRCQGITIEPKPVAKPHPPIWIANNAGPSGFGYGGDRALVERTMRRVVDHADGWETSLYDPEDLRWRIGFLNDYAREQGRDPKKIEKHLYHNVIINEDKQAGLAEAKKFLDIYYTTDFDADEIDGWVASGSPEECAERLRLWNDVGFDEVTLRIAGWDQFGQLKRLMTEVLPLVCTLSSKREEFADVTDSTRTENLAANRGAGRIARRRVSGVRATGLAPGAVVSVRVALPGRFRQLVGSGQRVSSG